MVKQNQFLGLPLDTKIDIVAIRKIGNEIESITIAEMTVSEWQNLKKKSGFQYIAYQENYHSFRPKTKNG